MAVEWEKAYAVALKTHADLQPWMATIALHHITWVKKNSADSPCFDPRKSNGDQLCFVLKTANLQVIGQSEMYQRDKAKENGIKGVQKNGGATKVEVLS